MRKSLVLGLMLLVSLILFSQATYAQIINTISGRVTTSSGYGISKARIEVVSEEGIHYGALTSPFGYYSIGVPSSSYVHFVSCSHKFYTFSTDNPRVLNVLDDEENVDFIADPF